MYVFDRFYMTPLKFTVNSPALNPDRMQSLPPITFLSKRPAALHTAETLRVPVLIQSGDHFLNNKSNRKLNGSRCVGVLLHISELCDTHASLSHLEWACCIVHSEGRRGWSSPTRSTVVHPSRRSCDCLTLSRTRCTQSAPGATPFQEPLPPARGNSPKLTNEQRPPNISFMNMLKSFLERA